MRECGIYRGSVVVVQPPQWWSNFDGQVWNGKPHSATVISAPMKFHGELIADVRLEHGLICLCMPLRYMRLEDPDA